MTKNTSNAALNAPGMAPCPLVSIIIPCRNEANFIDMCLDSILANDYPKRFLEIIVADGMSLDDTRVIVTNYMEKYPFIKLLDNPKKIQAAALNLAVAQAKGDIIIRMDAHCTYHQKYISRCVRALLAHKAASVGGRWKIIPRTNTCIGRAVALALSHPFGVGNASYRFTNDSKPRPVDALPFFCVSKEWLQRLGPFNEQVGPTEDMDFNYRLRKAGGQILLVPDIISCYYARSDLPSFLKHSWRNGLWVTLPLLHSRFLPVSWRHLVPLAFVSGLGVSAGLALAGLWGWAPFLVLAGSYTLVNLAASAQAAWAAKDPRYFFTLPLVFAALHLTYGLGSLWGLGKVLLGKMARFGSSPVKARQIGP